MAEYMEANESTVREILGLSFDRFGFQNETDLINRITDLLTDDSLKDSNMGRGKTSSPAAEEVENLLWNYSVGGTSTQAMCNLFAAVGRENELAQQIGWDWDLWKQLERSRNTKAEALKMSESTN